MAETAVDKLREQSMLHAACVADDQLIVAAGTVDSWTGQASNTHVRLFTDRSAYAVKGELCVLLVGVDSAGFAGRGAVVRSRRRCQSSNTILDRVHSTVRLLPVGT